MKTVFEIQHADLNIKSTNSEKFVKEDLKGKAIKTTEVETLNIYYVPATQSVFYVAVKKDGSDVKGALSANDVPAYEEAVKVAPKKAATKKVEKTVEKVEKTVVKVEKKPAVKSVAKKAVKK